MFHSWARFLALTWYEQGQHVRHERLPVSEFDELQAAIRRYVHERQAEEQACQAFINALYHALRTASGPGLPLNNVTLDFTSDPANRLRPVPPGGFYAAWLRLGLCEVLVRVRRVAGAFQGEYGEGGCFRLEEIGEDALITLARGIIRDVADTYAGVERERIRPLN
ncbi:hypothetical protein [Deinococcus humi]|uniref:Uncharacterized protein n=1 Tax=Deinococcus humi TaxID=662880 RepID=A0A7W8JVJ5_9DEIO|nr:hypothetical protein [Deinococcus humi]MBB5362748.1 hypothetical protein [Deinococcus humi]GGO30848.1 hypothetical protein GCM10008949_25990 [Deinococcus humi]